MVSDNGIATCLDAATGKVHWTQRMGGNHSASPVHADGRIYFLSEEGDAVVLAPGKEYRMLAKNSIGERTLASLAVSGKAIYLRGDQNLYRIETV
jgi:outer membrane protein assembly factor BamB